MRISVVCIAVITTVTLASVVYEVNANIIVNTKCWKC